MKYIKHDLLKVKNGVVNNNANLACKHFENKAKSISSSIHSLNKMHRKATESYF